MSIRPHAFQTLEPSTIESEGLINSLLYEMISFDIVETRKCPGGRALLFLRPDQICTDFLDPPDYVRNARWRDLSHGA
jgi:hypothetical protein